jgi:arginyl-tRNA synthetase
MDFELKIKQDIVKTINKAFGADTCNLNDLVTPPQSNMGCLSLPCFKLLKKLKVKNPTAAAELLATKLAKSKNFSCQVMGPYLNFDYTIAYLQKIVNHSEVNYGYNQEGKGKKIMLEFSNANTHKEYHIGHLRNLLYGDVVSKILNANGYQAIPVSYINDFGIHVAKTLWQYQKTPNTDLGKTYAKAVKNLKDNPQAETEVKNIMSQIEKRQGKIYKLWQKTRLISIKQFHNIYKDLGINFSKTYYESEVIDQGFELLKKTGI